MKSKNPRLGSSFDDYLKEQGRFSETQSIATKRVIAWQLQQAMAEQGLSKNKMAARMKTSRSQLDRILDANEDHVQLNTLIRAARAVGYELSIQLI